MLSDSRELLLGRVGEREVAIPSGQVERIMRMVALTPLADAPTGVAGLLNLQGDILAVVDPRPALGLPTPEPRLDQRLVLLSATTRFALWLDAVDQIVSVAESGLEAYLVDRASSVTPLVVRIGERIVPVLAPQALDPGVILDPVAGRAG